MLKSIRILLSIVGNYGYEIWQIEVKQTFPNGSLDESIFIRQSDGFIEKRKEHMLCKLKRSIYWLKQASRAWNTCFDTAVKSFGFGQCLDESCV